MYPLLELGPLRLSTGGLLLLLATLWWSQRVGEAAAAVGGVQWIERAERCVAPVLAGAIIGARLWYGLLSWDLYGADPWLFLALRVADLAWPGALLGGALALVWAARRVRASYIILADALALALALPQALGALALIFSGEAAGQPTDLPWAITMLGAQRHPTQLLYVAAALIIWLALRWQAQRNPVPGILVATSLGLQGLSMLLIEALRADSLLLPAGIRAGQVFGLCCVAGSLLWFRRRSLKQAARP